MRYRAGLSRGVELRRESVKERRIGVIASQRGNKPM